MANKLINTEKLTAIADAIRGKTGSTDTHSVDGMVDAINNIPVGGGGDTSMEDELVEGTLTKYLNDRVTKIGDYVFSNYMSLTTADFPTVTSIGTYAFYDCRSLTTANFPAVTSIKSRAFFQCSSLTTADFPTVTSIGAYAFEFCYLLTTADFPTVTSIGAYAFHCCSSITTANFPAVTSVLGYTFQQCSSLTIADFPTVTSIGRSAFQACYSLTALILRNTTNICTLSNTSAFTDCYHYHGTENATYNPDGLQNGFIYVPARLIDDYKEATNWSTLETQFRALEDYTVDGTTIGELDESKI